jgi:hypothetical protein
MMTTYLMSQEQVESATVGTGTDVKVGLGVTVGVGWGVEESSVGDGSRAEAGAVGVGKLPVMTVVETTGGRAVGAGAPTVPTAQPANKNDIDRSKVEICKFLQRFIGFMKTVL